MKINSYELIGILNSTLIECNAQFYDSEEKKYLLIEDDEEIPDENVAKICTTRTYVKI